MKGSIMLVFSSENADGGSSQSFSMQWLLSYLSFTFIAYHQSRYYFQKIELAQLSNVSLAEDLV
jgi:hypothetical protein